MPRLIVNADDLGLTNGVNRAILKAHQEGLVTSATLMANAPGFEKAVAALKTLPEYRERKLGIGCHVVLVDGTPVSPPEIVRSLLDPSLRTTAFHKKFSTFAIRAMRGKISANEVESEATAQIRKVQRAGIEVSHVDCHKHAHMFPAVLEGVLRAAKVTGVGALRNPFEPGFARSRGFNPLRSNGMRPAQTAVLRSLYAKRFLERVRESGLATTDGSIGITVTGDLDLYAFEALARNLPAQGTYEFVCHPGYNDRDLANAGTRLLQSRETELQVLCSKEARIVLQARNVQLINFWKLPASS